MFKLVRMFGIMPGLMGMHVRMAYGIGAAEKPAGLMRREVGDYASAWFKVVGYSLKRMGFHHRLHHLFIHCQRNVNSSSLDYGRPMLIPKGMSKFKAGAA